MQYTSTWDWVKKVNNYEDMENQSIKHLVGILYKNFMKVDQFIISPDLFILDFETDNEI